jgi:hypothetical protein
MAKLAMTLNIRVATMMLFVTALGTRRLRESIDTGYCDPHGPALSKALS